MHNIINLEYCLSCLEDRVRYLSGNLQNCRTSFILFVLAKLQILGMFRKHHHIDRRKQTGTRLNREHIFPTST